MVFQLVTRVDGISQKPTELTVAVVSSTFHDVGGNGHARTNHLVAQWREVSFTHTSRDAVNVQSQRMRLPPNAEFAEFPHADL
jgi:hypothetical protein